MFGCARLSLAQSGTCVFGPGARFFSQKLVFPFSEELEVAFVEPVQIESVVGPVGGGGECPFEGLGSRVVPALVRVTAAKVLESQGDRLPVRSDGGEVVDNSGSDRSALPEFSVVDARTEDLAFTGSLYRRHRDADQACRRANFYPREVLALAVSQFRREGRLAVRPLREAHPPLPLALWSPWQVVDPRVLGI